MKCRSVDRGTELHLTHPGNAHRLVVMTLLLCSVVSVSSPYPTWAAVYQCLDAARKTVLTNKQSALQHCQVLREETPPTSTPPVSGTTPQVSAPPVNPDMPPAPPYVPSMPMLPPRLPYTQGESIGSQPAPNPDTSSSSSPQPCSLGLNPLNPMSGPPCVPSNQSGTQPSGAVPTLDLNKDRP
jgi:hypothetical protein